MTIYFKQHIDASYAEALDRTQLQALIGRTRYQCIGDAEDHWTDPKT